MKIFLLASLILVLSACASYPDNVSVVEGTELTSFGDVTKSESTLTGKTVRWSGIIAKVSNEKTVTKLDVLYYPASRNGRPKTTDDPLGRFRVVIEGFIDPAIYKQGKAITALGQLKTSETAKIGEYEYEYPTLISKNIHLWEPLVIQPQVQFNYGWYGYNPRWHWRGGVRHVYVIGQGQTKKPTGQAKPKLSH
ncbi:Slp/YeaY family lipoprotein [uncultured Psychrosphaera sp.]|jgi:outer membrane lipoprotein|uniref:Slp family lipoprotein n=1 Tax=uncultured Psychrosphaera sp. TaxID=1403522 RepID=UPI002609AD16|nr:Slp/YeaY family lipoprotein [uncultured Psychrosphaera sp.]